MFNIKKIKITVTLRYVISVLSRISITAARCVALRGVVWREK